MLLFRKEKAGFDRDHLSKWGADWRVGPGRSAEGSKKAKKKKKSKSKSKK